MCLPGCQQSASNSNTILIWYIAYRLYCRSILGLLQDCTPTTLLHTLSKCHAQELVSRIPTATSRYYINDRGVVKPLDKGHKAGGPWNFILILRSLAPKHAPNQENARHLQIQTFTTSFQRNQDHLCICSEIWDDWQGWNPKRDPIGTSRSTLIFTTSPPFLKGSTVHQFTLQHWRPSRWGLHWRQPGHHHAPEVPKLDMDVTNGTFLW